LKIPKICSLHTPLLVMWKPSTKTGKLLIMSSLLALGSVSCSSDSAETSASPSPSPVASPATSPPASPSTSPSASPSISLAPVLKPKPPGVQKAVASPTPTPSPNSETFDRAMDIAAGAVTISKSAVSRDDWKLVASYWQQAINLLKQVPSSSPKGALAQTKLSQYQRLLAEAKEKSAPPLKKTTQGDVNPQFFSVPIKGRRHGTPIIEVNFNGARKFEMLFDTGANVTLITREMAYSLRLKPQGLTKVTVADGAEVVVYQTTLKTLEIDGRVKRNMQVVVAPPAMQEGLLGQDFYEGYDIAIKEDIIEFRKRS
jgi:predicted aspartyl protease